MNEKHRIFWSHYLRWLADKMALQDWTVGIAVDAAEDGANATVHRSRGRKMAMVALKPDWETNYSPEEQRQTLVHELLHCHVMGCDILLADARENHKKSWMMHLELNIGVQQEYAIDAIAQVLAPFLPLPPKYNKHFEWSHIERKVGDYDLPETVGLAAERAEPDPIDPAMVAWTEGGSRR